MRRIGWQTCSSANVGVPQSASFLEASSKLPRSFLEASSKRIVPRSFLEAHRRPCPSLVAQPPPYQLSRRQCQRERRAPKVRGAELGTIRAELGLASAELGTGRAPRCKGRMALETAAAGQLPSPPDSTQHSHRPGHPEVSYIEACSRRLDLFRPISARYGGRRGGAAWT